MYLYIKIIVFYLYMISFGNNLGYEEWEERESKMGSDKS